MISKRYKIPFISILKYEKIMLLEIKIVICMELGSNWKETQELG